MKNEDQKSMEVENDPISRLLGSLKRVEAPGDFDFRVKARIAQGRPVDRNASLLPAWMRLAVPLVLLVLIGGYFGFNGLYSPKPVVQPVAESQPPIAAPPSEIPKTDIIESPANGTLAKGADEKSPDSTEAKVASPDKLVIKTGSNKNSGGGSIDFSSGIGTTIRPKGLNQSKAVPKPKDITNPAGIPVKDVLSLNGIEANYSNSLWTVGAVKQNSAAERSGLKSGDVIEALDGQSLGGKTTFGNKVSTKSIRVRRDGKIMQIDLKP